MIARIAALAVSLSLVSAASAAAVPTIERDVLDPGVLRVISPTVSGQDEYISVRPHGPGALIIPNFDAPPPADLWNVTAPDCAQDPATKEIRCAAAVTSLVMLGGDGDDGFDVKKVRFPLTADAGAGDDYVGGSLVDDVIELGDGDDLAGPDKGNDRISGGAGDDKLFGGPGRDRIQGDQGRDRLGGEGGVDRLLARDGTADARIDCGAGADGKERAIVDRTDPKPKSC